MYFEERYLSPEQRMMRDTSRRDVDLVVAPFLRADRTREWSMDPDDLLAPHLIF